MEWARLGGRGINRGINTWEYEDDIIFDHDEDIHGTNRIELHEQWMNLKSISDKRQRTDGGANSLMR